MSFGGAMTRLPLSTAVTWSSVKVFCSMAREEYTERMRFVRRSTGLAESPAVPLILPISSPISTASERISGVIVNSG